MAGERLYHVLAWNPTGKDLFPERKDRVRFLKLLRKARESGSLKVYAYCLLKDKAQMACACPDGMIGKVIASVEGVYMSYCRGKYKDDAPEWEQEVYECRWEGLLDLVRYVHRAPLRAKRRRTLWYRWSSHGDYLAEDGRWVDYREVLAVYGKKERAALRRYRRYIRSRRKDLPITSFYLLPEAAAGPAPKTKPAAAPQEEVPDFGGIEVIESAELVDDDATAAWIEADGAMNPPEEGQEAENADTEAGRTVSPERIIELVAEVMGVKPESFAQNGGTPQEVAARRVALYLLKDEAGLTNAQTGQVLGMAPSTVSKLYNDEQMRDDLAGKIDRIRRRLRG